MEICKNGVYPAMLTPFDKSNKVDYGAVKELTEWYIKCGCQGVFATCMSSEIFFLTADERYNIAKTVIETAEDRMDVVVSGHTEDSIDEQIEQLKRVASLGAKSVVLITNRLISENQSEDSFKINLYKILNALPNTDFGLYECPHPYTMELSPSLMKWCAQTGRINFMKDTCCSLEKITPKIKAVSGTPLKVFNAHSVTLLDSVKAGAAGLCGVLANFHPDLYVKMLNFYETDPEKAERLQDLLGVNSMINYGFYPASAKYYLGLEGLDFASIGTRNAPDIVLPDMITLEMQQRFRHTQWLRQNIDLL